MTTASLNKRYCKVCFKEIKLDTLHALIHKDLCLCNDCLDLMEPKLIKTNIEGVYGYILYYYNDKIKELIYTLKGCYDIELSSVFLNYYLNRFKIKNRGYYIVPAASYKLSDYKRGFNHVISIFKNLNLPILDVIEKTKNFKQSDLTINQRMKIQSKIAIRNGERLKNKKIIFVDDILTTGSTLRGSLRLIKNFKPKRLKFLIIAKVTKKD